MITSSGKIRRSLESLGFITLIFGRHARCPCNRIGFCIACRCSQTPWSALRRTSKCTCRCHSLDTHDSASRRLGDPLSSRDDTWLVNESLACSATGLFSSSRGWPVLTKKQSTGFALTIGGYLLGHAHKGRQFLPSVHGTFGSLLFIPIIAQLSIGIYLKLHIHERSIRPYFVIAHGILGRLYPVLGWTQMLLGAITFRGYCRGEHLGTVAKSTAKTYKLTLFHRPMFSPLYHGRWLHCLCHYYGNHDARWWSVDTSIWKESRVLGFLVSFPHILSSGFGVWLCPGS